MKHTYRIHAVAVLAAVIGFAATPAAAGDGDVIEATSLRFHGYMPRDGGEIPRARRITRNEDFLVRLAQGISTILANGGALENFKLGWVNTCDTPFDWTTQIVVWDETQDEGDEIVQIVAETEPDSLRVIQGKQTNGEEPRLKFTQTLTFSAINADEDIGIRGGTLNIRGHSKVDEDGCPFDEMIRFIGYVDVNDADALGDPIEYSLVIVDGRVRLALDEDEFPLGEEAPPPPPNPNPNPNPDPDQQPGDGE